MLDCIPFLEVKTTETSICNVSVSKETVYGEVSWITEESRLETDFLKKIIMVVQLITWY